MSLGDTDSVREGLHRAIDSGEAGIAARAAFDLADLLASEGDLQGARAAAAAGYRLR